MRCLKAPVLSPWSRPNAARVWSSRLGKAVPTIEWELESRSLVTTEFSYEKQWASNYGGILEADLVHHAMAS